MSKILIVEDEAILLDAYKILMETQDGYDVHYASNGKEAYNACQKTVFDLIMLDLMMPVLDGVGFLKKANLSVTHPDTKILIMSNLSSGDMLIQALESGAHDHYVKSSLGPAEILNIIETHLAKI